MPTPALPWLYGIRQLCICKPHKFCSFLICCVLQVTDGLNHRRCVPECMSTSISQHCLCLHCSGIPCTCLQQLRKPGTIMFAQCMNVLYSRIRLSSYVTPHLLPAFSSTSCLFYCDITSLQMTFNLTLRSMI